MNRSIRSLAAPGVLAAAFFVSRASAATPTLPPCAQVSSPVSMPADFPQSVPLPPGTVLKGSQHTPQEIVINGVIPNSKIDATLFFIQRLPALGFKLEGGDVELGRAEARFAGNGISGSFKIVAIDCAGACSFALRIKATP